MDRIQTKYIRADLKKKLVFVVGPRQVGKTWISKQIMGQYKNPMYLSYDSLKDRAIIKQELWSKEVDLIVFDEIHKMQAWKNYLKGVYDTKPDTLHILVTGSARLDAHKQAGDSLAGRYRVHHLLPISYKELTAAKMESTQSIPMLIQRSGFPEPYFAKSSAEVSIWRNLYSQSLLREDVIDFGTIDNFAAIRTVFELIRTKVGSPISYANLAQDTGISPKTVRKYVSILESLYIIFLIRPYSTKIKRSILKEPKAYFYDTGLVVGDDGVKFENMIAVSLLKHAHGVTDEKGVVKNLMTLRTKDRQEVDFALISNGVVSQIIEVKIADEIYSQNLKYFTDLYGVLGVQVVKNARHNKHIKGYGEVKKAEDYLQSLHI